MKILKMEQGTPEWNDARCGIITMSNVGVLLEKGRSTRSGLSAGARSYMDTLLAERMTGESANQWAGNAHTQRGHVLEPEALRLYMAQEDTNADACERVGIILNHGCGYSPDLLVGDSGACEVKSKLPKLLVRILLDGNVPQEHMAQIQGGLWVSEREWCDFIAYWPGLPLFVKRVYRDDVMIHSIRNAVDLFYLELDLNYKLLAGM